MVKVGGTQVGSVYNTLASASPYTFSVSSPINIPAGHSVTVDVYANTLGATYGAVPVVALSSVSATGASTNSILSIVSKDGQNVTISTGGALTFDSLTIPSSQNVSAGVTGVKLGSFTFKADNNENINLTEVDVKDTGAQASTLNDLTNIRLMNGTTQVGTTAGSLDTAANTAFLINAGSAGSVVSQNGYITLDIIADINGASVITSGDEHILSINGVSFQGASSGQPGTPIADGSITDNTAAFKVYRTNLIATQGGVSVDNNIYDNKTVASFKLTADNGGPAKAISIDLQAVGAAVGGGAVGIHVFNGNSEVAMDSNTLTGTTHQVFTFTNAITIPAGGSITLTVKENLTTASYTASSPVKSYGVNLLTYVWDDGSGLNNITPDASISLPIAGPGMAF
jgi:hypothetical protein